MIFLPTFLAYDNRSGQGMYFLKITTTRHQQRLILVENILYTKIPYLTTLSIMLDESIMEGRMASSKLNLYGGLFRNLWSSRFFKEKSERAHGYACHSLAARYSSVL